MGDRYCSGCPEFSRGWIPVVPEQVQLKQPGGYVEGIIPTGGGHHCWCCRPYRFALWFLWEQLRLSFWRRVVRFRSWREGAHS
jgi:hypothetical protein